jgi:CheY-like chemotaxis protein
MLIVDDEPLICSGLSKALKGLLAVVETADTGERPNQRLRLFAPTNRWSGNFSTQMFHLRGVDANHHRNTPNWLQS